MRNYFRFEKAICIFAWTRTRKLLFHNWRQVWQPVASGFFGIAVLYLMAGPEVVHQQILLAGSALAGIGLLFLLVLGWQVIAAPYRLWDEQKIEVERLQGDLTTRKGRVTFEAGNGEDFLHGHSNYMLKVTNHGKTASNCLVRLLSVIESESKTVVNTALPTRGQWEDQRRGEFNLRQDESKHVMLIGRFPDGWRFLLEKTLSDPVTLDSAIIVEVAMFGCGPKSSAKIIIELLDESTNLLRLSIDE